MKIIQAFRQLPRHIPATAGALISNILSKENMTPLKNIYKNNNLIAEEKWNEMETSDGIILKFSNLGHVLVQALIWGINSNNFQLLNGMKSFS